MPALPPYVRFWADRLWADLPEKTTPIIAAALAHWDDWHARTRDRIEELAGNVTDLDGATSGSLAGVDARVSKLDAAKADKSTKIAPGTGLTGGGDLSADRSLSVAYGTTAGTATAGDDARVTNAVQTPAGAARGDLLVIDDQGKAQRLPRTAAGLLLGSGASSPGWITPESTGLGLPTPKGGGNIVVSQPDNTWALLAPPEATESGGMILGYDKYAGEKLAWLTPSNVNWSVGKKYRFPASASPSSAMLAPGTFIRMQFQTPTSSAVFFVEMTSNRTSSLGWPVTYGGTSTDAYRANYDTSYSPIWNLIYVLPPDLRPASTYSAVIYSATQFQAAASQSAPSSSRSPMYTGTSYDTLDITLRVDPDGSLYIACTSPLTTNKNYSNVMKYVWWNYPNDAYDNKFIPTSSTTYGWNTGYKPV